MSEVIEEKKECELLSEDKLGKISGGAADSSNLTSVTVPNVIGKSEYDAVTKLSSLGFKVNRETKKSSLYHSGFVISTLPGCGFPVLSGSTVTIVVAV